MNPVQSLQHMLNHLARTIQALPRLAETGIFDEETLEAVMIFQRDNNLPVTGIVNQVTWDTITALYFDQLLQFGPPPPLHVFPGHQESGGQGPELRIVQAMFEELAKLISNFQSVGTDSPNSNAVFHNLRILQALAALPDSGILDRPTWSVLSHLYNTYVTRRAMRTFPLSV